ncbi:MAG: hypothetical protein ACLP9L_41435 [Thermoguttaceae bacterium]
MPIDWEQVRINNRALQAQAPVTLSADEAAWLEQRRKDEAVRRERERQEADVKAYAAFAAGKAEAARKSGDLERAKVWDAAAGNIGNGTWLVHKTISSDPEVVRFQGLRTALLYEGKAAQLREPSAYSTYMKENEDA